MTQAEAERLRELALSAATAARVVGVLYALGRPHKKEESEYQTAVTEFDSELQLFVSQQI